MKIEKTITCLDESKVTRRKSESKFAKPGNKRHSKQTGAVRKQCTLKIEYYSSNQEPVISVSFGGIDAGDLSGCEPGKRRMRAQKVVEEQENRNQAIGTFERPEPTFRLIPGLKLIVKCLDQVVGNIVLKVLDLNMSLRIKIKTSGLFIGKIAI